MQNLRKFIAAASIVLVAAACSESTGPGVQADEAAFSAVSAELASMTAGVPNVGSTDPNTAPPPLLARLTHSALANLTAKGAVEAKGKLVAELQARHEALRAAVASGNQEAIRTAHGELDGTQARIVVMVLSPRIVGEVHKMVGHQVGAIAGVLERAEAEGKDVTGPRRVLESVVGIMAESRKAMEAGNPVAALLLATHAADRIQAVFHR